MGKEKDRLSGYPGDSLKLAGKLGAAAAAGNEIEVGRLLDAAEAEEAEAEAGNG